MKYKKAIGIDPGNTGAIAFIYGEPEDLIIFDMPIIKEKNGKTKKRKDKYKVYLDEIEFKKILDWAKPEIIFIEKSQAMPKQGVSSMFHYAVSFGLIRGICIGLNIPYKLITPVSWKKGLGIQNKRKLNRVTKDQIKKELKEKSIKLAKQLYPKADIGESDGRAEALLILHYGAKL